MDSNFKVGERVITINSDNQSKSFGYETNGIGYSFIIDHIIPNVGTSIYFTSEESVGGFFDNELRKDGFINLEL